MSSKRVFIALDISDEAREVCSSHIHRLRQNFRDVRVGWERSEKLHITVKFLGDIGPPTLGKLESAIREIAGRHMALRLRLSRTGAFPSKQRPRILWIGLEEVSGSITPLHAEIENACRRLGFTEEGRRFRPHVTIGRIREPIRALRLCEEHLRTTVEPIPFAVAEVVIYESKLQQTGSVYSPISQVALRHA